MEKNLFSRFAQAVASVSGHAWTFICAIGLILVWAITGPFFDFSDTWQLVVNTGTTIITFLMVFLIQNTQNRDTYAMQLKLDELIHSNQDAHNSLMDIEELNEKQLCELRDYYEGLAREARNDPEENRKSNDDFPLNRIIENGSKKKYSIAVSK